MLRLLERSWFLLALAIIAALASIAPQGLGWAAELDPRFIVAPALFLMGWTLPSRSLGNVVLRPWPALWAVAISYGAVPALAWLLGALLPVEDFRIGLLIMACVPCTLASAVLWTRMAGGDEVTALLVVLLTTATSWLVTPALLVLLTGTAVAIDARAMMAELFLTLVLPVALGQVCRWPHALGRFASQHRRVLGILSQVLILLILLKAVEVLSLRLRSESALPGPLSLGLLVGTCLGLHLAALGIGLWTGGWLGFGREVRVAIAFGCSQKTLPVSLLIWERYFPRYPLAVVPLVAYHFGQLLVDTFIAQRLHQTATMVYNLQPASRTA